MVRNAFARCERCNDAAEVLVSGGTLRCVHGQRIVKVYRRG